MQSITRTTLWLLFFGCILVSWWWLYTMAIDMDVDLLGRPGEKGARMAAMDPRMPMYMPMANFGPLFSMWAIMMAAMMLPTMVPSLRAYEDLLTSVGADRSGWVGLLVGYSIVWLVFAAVITVAQLALLYGGVVDMLGIAKSYWFTGSLLLAVGAFQFTRTKEMCHGVCHNPAFYFVGRWRRGFAPGVHMGLHLGAFCVVCCWGFMALGFAGGVMNLAWMGLATLFMVIEKLPQVGHYVTRPMGFALLIAGAAVLGWPFVMGG